MTDILDRNATCPICGKFYHNIDIHNNPIPSPQNKRTEASLCQCQKGKDAREYRKTRRHELKAEREAKEQRREDILSMHSRNKEYWAEVNK